MSPTPIKANLESLAHAYFYAKKFIIASGYSDEIDWQDQVDFGSLDQSTFLREVAWVILSSGISERVIARKFNKIGRLFYNWHLNLILADLNGCKKSVLQEFNNKRKIEAICDACIIVHSIGIEEIKTKLLQNGISYLTNFPYIGEITKYHLAKNIGFRTSKPDRHLVRIANLIGYDDSHQLCSLLSKKIDEKIAVVDLVIWRYASIRKDYLNDLNRFIEKDLDRQSPTAFNYVSSSIQ